MRRRGFTLAEVLVSLAIFALAAVALSAAYTNVLLARQAMRRLDATDDAVTRARAALLETASLEDAKAGGEIDLPDSRTARWSTEVEPTAVSDLFSVTLRVESSDAGGKSEPPRAQTIYLLRPSWSVSGDRDKLTQAARERLRKLRPFEGTSTIDQQGQVAGAAGGGGRKDGGGRGEGGGRGQGGGQQGGGRGENGGGRGDGNNGGGRPGGRPGEGQGGQPGGGPGGQPPGRGGNPAGGGGAPRGP